MLNKECRDLATNLAFLYEPLGGKPQDFFLVSYSASGVKYINLNGELPETSKTYWKHHTLTISKSCRRICVSFLVSYAGFCAVFLASYAEVWLQLLNLNGELPETSRTDWKHHTLAISKSCWRICVSFLQRSLRATKKGKGGNIKHTKGLRMYLSTLLLYKMVSPRVWQVRLWQSLSPTKI